MARLLAVVAIAASATNAVAFVPVSSPLSSTRCWRSLAASHAPPHLAALAASAGTVDGASLAGLFSTGVDDERPSSAMVNLENIAPTDGRSRTITSTGGSSSTESSSGDGEVTEAQLLARTLETLDWPKVLEALAKEATSTLGRRQASQLELASSLAQAQQQYAAVREAGTVLDALPPLRSAMDAEAELVLATSGQVLDGAQLAQVSRVLSDLAALRSHLLTHPRALAEDVDTKLAAAAENKAKGATETNEHAGNDASRFGVDRFGGDIPLLCGMARGIVLPDTLVAALEGAFDERQQLSEARFPQLGSLRRQAEQLYASISATVSGLMAGALKDAVAEPRVMEVGGRFLLPIKPSYKAGVGIVHDMSRTGRTVYVEPAAVVEPTNELKAAQVALKVEEQRIYRDLTLLVRKALPAITHALDAAAQVDLVVARVKLGRRLGGQVPEVRGDGDIALRGFRHPVLVLRSLSGGSRLPGSGAAAAAGLTGNAAVRAANNAAAGVAFRGLDGSVSAAAPALQSPEMQVVGNDLSLNASVPGLVLTGPNAGGKTVVLKSLGLAALLAKAGIPVPCAPGFTPRVDFFSTVLADIGDMQSVGGDLSTFSGHLLVCKAVLAQTHHAAGGEGASLVLMDEIGSGTDPAQGVALAQALLEAILATGARTALTTHYLQLKDLAAADARFEVAGMEFVDGQPTYRLKYGFVGESHALAVAARLQLPPEVVARARELLDDGARQVSDLIAKLEQETAAAELARASLAAQQAGAVAAKEAADKAERAAAERYAGAWASAAADYAVRVDASEKKLEDLLRDLKEAFAANGGAGGNSGGSGSAGKLLAELAGNSLAEVRLVAQQAARDADTTPTLPVVALTSADAVDEGDQVIVNKKGTPWFGSPATVVRCSRNQVEVNVGGEVVRLKKADLARAADPAASLAAAQQAENALLQQQSAKLGISRDELFAQLDANGDGELSKAEVVAGHALLGVSPDAAGQLFDAKADAARATQADAAARANESPMDAARRARGAALLAAKAQAAAARKAGGSSSGSSSVGSARPPGLSKRTAAYSSAESSSSSSSSRSRSSGGKTSSSPGARPAPSGGKTSGNTVDLLGLTVYEAQSIVERRMSNAQMSGTPTLYLLHGHGTGALKKGLRTWLRTSMGARVRSWRPGGEGDGGDAFTVVELK